MILVKVFSENLATLFYRYTVASLDPRLALKVSVDRCQMTQGYHSFRLSRLFSFAHIGVRSNLFTSFFLNFYGF